VTTKRSATFLREEATRQAALALAAKREADLLRDVLREVRLYAEKMLRSGDGTTRIHGADLLQLLDDAEH
jgi:hypothetical protein